MTDTRVTKAIDQILDAIAEGSFTSESPLPPEVELMEFLDVSRSTMREAVRDLSARGVLNVVHGRGTFVNPISRWTDLATVARFLTSTASPRRVGTLLIEVRRMIEVGSSGLAAQNRSEADMESMSQALEAFDVAAGKNDVEKVANADLAFHNAILRASGNPFLPPIMQPLQEALESSRRHASANPAIRKRARSHHLAIFQAIRDGDQDGAKNAMRAHMTQTHKDIDAFLTDRPEN